ncbi:Kef-type K+ transport system, membrane component KefB [Stigmatella aurantiaca]|uniref:Kef-type K+ transport system, membrane component KefB n=1 Tax=Stigmatella aurantiaca TaxID=41 RepID=A0A1H7JKJ3_STIAU|nr:cation:proton antiporter [Stigmatella aurantiaca]SEK75198.1 Kef-type K+ transport system, membrane component KefB [Stigmatella aurantiaca]
MIGAIIRLVLLVVLLAGISRAQLWRVDSGTPVLLAAGALLLCGLFAGKVAKGVGLPRLTGYLLVGVAVGPYAMGFIPGEGVKGLELVKGLGVSLIALVAGTELHLGLIRRVGAKVAVLCVTVCGITFGVCFAAIFALKPLLPFLAPMTVPQALAVSALVSTVVVSFSPTVTIAIVQETAARGSFTEFLMALVIIGDLFVMVAFALAAGVTRASFGGGFDIGGLLSGVGWELFGSVAVGAVLALGMLVYMRRVNRELPLFLVGICFAAAEGGAQLHLSPLLVALAAGALIANLDERQSRNIHHAIQFAGLPVFALFFAAAGAGLKLDTLVTVGPAALLLVVLRAVAILLACRRFAPMEDPRLRRYLWMGLISQAGVTFGLAALVSRTFPDFGPQVEVLIVAMITTHELVGPVLTRRALERSGETRGDERPRTA